MTLPCPRCAGPLAAPAQDAPDTLSCPTCGLLMASAYLRETVELGEWHAWAGQRLTWLHDRLLAGDQPTGGEAPATRPPEVRGTPAASVPPSRPPAGAGSLLLAAGAFLLIVAGIAFLAFTWNLLGPFGQISVLLLLGAACLAATSRLLDRLRGTATTLGIVGTFLVTIAAIGARVLGPDLIGPSASLLVAIGILTGLTAGAIWLRPRTTPVGELAGVVAAALFTVLMVSAPASEALPLPEPWTWWVALITSASGVLLLLLADRARLKSWPWLGAVLLVVASIALAFTGLDAIDTVPEVEPSVVAALLLAAATLVAVGRRVLPHGPAVAAAMVTTWLLALIVAWTSSVFDAPARQSGAMSLAAAGALAFIPGLFRLRPTWLRGSTLLLGAASIGAAVGLLLAPWADPAEDYYGTAQRWAAEAWPAWRGLASGLAVVAVLAASVALVPMLVGRLLEDRASTPLDSERESGLAWWRALPLVPAAATLATWLMAATSDLGVVTQGGAGRATSYYERQPTPEVFLHQVAIALAVVALGILVHALLRRLPDWSVWLLPVLGIPALFIELSTRTIETPWRPELVGLLIATPALVAGVARWWLRRPSPTPTWQTVGIPLSLLLAPPVVALLDATSSRWFVGGPTETEYQVRSVALLAVGAMAAVVGARQRWIGLFVPGLVVALTVVVIQLLDLGRFLPQWVSFGLAGALLLAAGARWEWVRDRGRVGATWVRTMR